MKLNAVKRAALSGLVALSVAGGSLAPMVAGHAAAGGRGGLCPKPDPCPVPFVTQATSAADGGLAGGVVAGGGSRDGAKLSIGSGANRDSIKPGQGDFRDSIKGGATGDFRDGGVAPQAGPDSDASKPSAGGDISW